MGLVSKDRRRKWTEASTIFASIELGIAQQDRQPKAFAGLFRCGECGMAITAEVQKGHTYYRCAKKSKARKCSQKFIREEDLEQQLSLMLCEYMLRPDWAAQMLEMAERDHEDISRYPVFSCMNPGRYSSKNLFVVEWCPG